MKQCTKCKQSKEYSEFYKNKNNKDGYHGWCKECVNQKYRDKYRHNRKKESPINTRNRLLKHNYGITSDEFDRILTSQGGGCAICSRKPEDSVRSFCVDHDHSCCPGTKTCGNCVRAIICTPCNLALGYAQDSPELLKNMVSYLQKFALV